MKKIFFKMAALMLLLSALEGTALNHLRSTPELGWPTSNGSMLAP